MYKEDCKEIRLEIDEANLHEELQFRTTEHLRVCTNCREFYEREMRLRQLVASMPQVEAPSDFDFRLRARLANESRRSAFSFASFGIPSVAVAALILLVGGVLVFRNTNNPSAPAKVASQNNVPAVDAAPKNTTLSTATAQEHTTAASKVPVAQHYPLVGKQLLAVQKNRSVTRDSSSVGATVVRQGTAVAGPQLPLLFPMQTLRVSVDDGRGVARTISFPTVSFGSERVLTRGGNSFQGSVKGDW